MSERADYKTVQIILSVDIDPISVAIYACIYTDKIWHINNAHTVNVLDISQHTVNVFPNVQQ